ncbi:HAD family hydrolase [Cytobacillus sp. NCCP-133]|uniref:HAD family hydrolase n=1 Tax=Cytobacillus sp. NCCP-133 TaxID=766848 RepID=UPI00222F017E|nr:HAD family phosphatase [Cytobacillus sp. NCCP-133]GLB60149.1 phosphatase [Cytobacillus sp. NCCP-133]
MDSYAIIFDMDGVIVDSEPVFKNLNEELFKELNISVPDEIRLQFIGGSANRKWRMIKEHCGVTQPLEDLISYQQKFFRFKNVHFDKILFPGARPLLENLRKQKIPTALASSSDRERIDKVLDDCDLHGYFRSIVSGEEFEESKPHPDIFLHSAAKLGVPPEHCIVIEDSLNGLTAASRAGMKKIGVKHKQIPMDLSRADLVISSLEEIDVFMLGKLLEEI